MTDERLRRRCIIAAAANAALIASARGQSQTELPQKDAASHNGSLLYPFDELCTSPDVTTFAYWVLVEREPLPEEAATLDALYYWMSHHYDVEEQASTEDSFITNDRCMPRYIRLIAPVTLAERWSPYTLANTLLGRPFRAERGNNGSHSRALGIWEPKVVDHPSAHAPKDLHERHFMFLLGLACSVAKKQSGRVIVVGSPGWSYQHWRDETRMMHPNVAVLMHEHGYLYTDRIPQ